MSFVLTVHFREGSLNFNFSISSTKSNYGDIFSLPNKLKFADSNICTKLLRWEQEITNNCPSDLLQSKSMNWFLYENGLRHERVKLFRNNPCCGNFAEMHSVRRVSGTLYKT